MEHGFEVSFLGPYQHLKKYIVLGQCQRLLMRITGLNALFYEVKKSELSRELERELRKCRFLWENMSEERIAEFLIWFFQSQGDWPSLCDVKSGLEVIIPDKFAHVVRRLGDMGEEDAERGSLIKEVYRAIYKCDPVKEF
ncbi:MAG: hypothetical protein HYW77_03425 [Parcubacteria group bacterium]|nr:hypothetical protein [Parcubacteria group bacterium]